MTSLSCSMISSDARRRWRRRLGRPPRFTDLHSGRYAGRTFAPPDAWGSAPFCGPSTPVTGSSPPGPKPSNADGSLRHRYAEATSCSSTSTTSMCSTCSIGCCRRWRTRGLTSDEAPASYDRGGAAAVRCAGGRRHPSYPEPPAGRRAADGACAGGGTSRQPRHVGRHAVAILFVGHRRRTCQLDPRLGRSRVRAWAAGTLVVDRRSQNAGVAPGTRSRDRAPAPRHRLGDGAGHRSRQRVFDGPDTPHLPAARLPPARVRVASRPSRVRKAPDSRTRHRTCRDDWRAPPCAR